MYNQFVILFIFIVNFKKIDKNNDFNIKMIVRCVPHKDFYVQVEASLFDVREWQVEQTNEWMNE